jgi:hypothetical protein
MFHRAQNLFPLSIQAIGIILTALVLDDGRTFRSFIALSIIYWFGILILDAMLHYFWNQNSSHARIIFVQKLFTLFYKVIVLKLGLILILFLSFIVRW